MSRTALLYLFTEFGPIVVFFAAGRLTDFYTAVAYFIAATVLACLFAWWRAKQVPVIPLVSAVFVIVGGLLTLLYDAPDAIIFADTLYYVLTAIVLGFSLWKTQGRFLQRLFNPVFALTPYGWKLLTRRWLLLLICAAVFNEIVRQTASPGFWIDYRFYKTIVITAFALYQFTLSRQHRVLGESNAWGIRIRPAQKKAH